MGAVNRSESLMSQNDPRNAKMQMTGFQFILTKFRSLVAKKPVANQCSCNVHCEKWRMHKKCSEKSKLACSHSVGHFVKQLVLFGDSVTIEFKKCLWKDVVATMTVSFVRPNLKFFLPYLTKMVSQNDQRNANILIRSLECISIDFRDLVAKKLKLVPDDRHVQCQ